LLTHVEAGGGDGGGGAVEQVGNLVALSERWAANDPALSRQLRRKLARFEVEERPKV
jgi:hypothetical protein